MIQVRVDISALKQTLYRYEQQMGRKKLKRLIQESAKPMIAAIKEETPVSKRGHYSYRVITGAKQKARAHYFTPGTLRRSVQKLPFRKTDSVFVGPKLSGLKGPYYAGWVNDGHPLPGGKMVQGKQYMLKGFNKGQGPTMQKLQMLLQRRVKALAKKGIVI